MKVTVLLFAGLLAGNTACAGISISPGGGCGSILSQSANRAYFPDGPWIITVSARATCSTGYTVNIRATDPNDSIQSIAITADDATTTGPAGFIAVSVRPTSYPFDTIPVIGSVTKAGGDADVIVILDQVGQIGSSSSPATIAVNRIDGIAVYKDPSYGYTGDVYASISATTGSRLEGFIAGLLCDGTLHGSVSATSWIGDFIAQGDIGSSSSPASVTFGNYLSNMRADAIYAAINGGSGFIERIETTVGNITGSIAAARVDTDGSGTPGIYIAGDLDADVTISDVVYYPIRIGGDVSASSTISIGTALGVNGTLKIGGDLDGDISIASGGLWGRIVVNESDSSHAWSGTVTVGSHALDSLQSQPNQAPYYNRLSSTLGGGAVGLVPFNLHGPDCLPEHNDTVLAPLASARVRHYGPITFSSGMPVKVERQPQTSPPTTTWTDVTAQFDAAISGSNARDLIVTPKSGYAFTAPAKYKITPGYESVDLRCADVTGNPDVHAYEYIFAVQPDVYDFSGGGGFGPEDLAAWLQDPVDINFDEVADEKDWDILMQALEDTGQ